MSESVHSGIKAVFTVHRLEQASSRFFSLTFLLRLLFSFFVSLLSDTITAVMPG